MIHRRFGVVDVFVDDEGGSSGVLVRADANLSYGAVLAEYVVHLLAGDVEGEVANVEHAVDFRGKTGIDLAETDCAHIGCGVFGGWEIARK